jgi:sodium/potassium-transporting ATPase subunit alpha
VVSLRSKAQYHDIDHCRAAYLRKYHPGWINVPTLIVDCVSVAIAFIPEGLPIALTASLTITANLMRQNKILCKSLKTVETLGAVSVICSDKTGTLTKVLPIYIQLTQC